MVRGFARDVILKAADTSIGHRALESILLRKPELAVEPLGRLLNRPARFAAVQSWPDQLDGFDRLAFLLSSNPLNWGIAALTFDEAAHLYRTIKTVGPGTLIEIGRFKGGSTFIIAAAMDPEARLYSYDLHVKLVNEFDGSVLDEELRLALARYRLDPRVELVVADSRTVTPPGTATLIFIDGDHSYEGARADYEHWRPSLEPGGHLLFHDGVPPEGIGGHHEEVARLVAEIERDDPALVRRQGAGTIAHFVLQEDD